MHCLYFALVRGWFSRSDITVGFALPGCAETTTGDSPRRARPVSRLHRAPGVVVPVDAERVAHRPVVGWGVARHHPGRNSEERARLAPPKDYKGTLLLLKKVVVQLYKLNMGFLV